MISAVPQNFLLATNFSSGSMGMRGDTRGLSAAGKERAPQKHGFIEIVRLFSNPNIPYAAL